MDSESRKSKKKGRERNSGLEVNALASVFAYSFVWVVGSPLQPEAWGRFDEFVRATLGARVAFPPTGCVLDYALALDSRDKGVPKQVAWRSRVGDFELDARAPLHSVYVPTAETARAAPLPPHTNPAHLGPL